MEPTAPKLILVPTDFSAPSAQALRYGAALAERFSAHLLVIYADPFLPPVDFTISACGTFNLPELIKSTSEQLDVFVQLNISAGIPCDTRVIVGSAVDSIFTEARESGADLIVMGTHGRTGLKRLILGSVAEAVVRFAPVPVIVVHQESKPHAAAMRRIVSARQSRKETVTAAAYARVLGRGAEFLELPAGADAATIARAGGADLFAVGIAGEHDQKVIRQITCPVLSVNRFAAARFTGVNVDEREPALTA